MIMLTRNKSAFTLLESLVTLAITACVLLTIEFCLPLLHTNSNTPPDIAFKGVIHQIEIQRYQFVNANEHQVALKSSEGKRMLLEVKNNKLQLSAVGAGQIILQQKVKSLTVKNCRGYFILKLLTHDDQTVDALLYLPKEK